ncbi:AbfB domain-containing protein [Micromonospora sp. NBC_01813]|uniref:AbfB domain-containing protein n=1 Tax=Micromonospora sp. NBC_01813 TaxID=2975988 RepID=UPI002DDC675D|nr:AbfB domain-containing protein [Micromonospora sp. NBC_01813]WSA10266.1 AbfB domain-containing protein [Micromonospora sp. NBC_01813]
MSSAASFLRRVTPTRPFTAIVPRSARYTARQAAAAAAAANRTAPAHLPAGGLGADTANTRGTTYGRNDDPVASRRLLLGAGALFAIAALLVVAVVRDGIDREPIRGEFAAGAPNVNTPAFGTDSPSPDGEGSPDASANGAPVGDPAASGGTDPDIGSDPGANPNPGTGGTPDPTPAGPTTPPAGNPTTPAPAPTAPATASLTPGSRIGLEVAALPGHRIRHRDGTVVVERVDSRSKDDAEFVVRSGLANRNCVSFESTNRSGFYLRHYDFRIFLQRNDGSAIFRADTTFCPVLGIGGQHTSFMSYNYPDRFLRHDGNRQMRISTTGDGASAATATFQVRPPL